MKKALKIGLLVIIILVAVGGISFYLKLDNVKEAAEAVEINNIDLSDINDGEYIGKYTLNEMSKVKLKVVVEDNKITGIDIIEHSHGPGKSGHEINDRIIEKQGLDVDYVSGATISSKIILKAVENALNGEGEI
ncbi:FMN-binding protein [Dethiothermospora halolimnae]|uniref:FMN-binding protein n=1 Tax=Dethiothermospora halolimnae TaxID=3114390 RepID=UPI003CCB9107